jgi:RNA polymerase sigma-70 factor (ECF subfamily)
MAKDSDTVLFNDVQLARKAQSDRAATEKLLERLYPKINQVIWAFVRNREQAEEIEQSVILEVLKYLGKYRGEGSLDAWAGEIAYRTTMKMLKKSWRWSKKRASISEFKDDFNNNEHLDESPERLVSRRQLYGLLAEKMEGIPESRRNAFVLHIIQGYTILEVSKVMNTPVDTIKYRLKTATKEMRGIFNENPHLREAMLEVIK